MCKREALVRNRRTEKMPPRFTVILLPSFVLLSQKWQWLLLSIFERILIYFLTISFMYIMHCNCIQFSYPLLFLSHLCWFLSSLVVSTPPLPYAGALQEVRATLCCDCSGLMTSLETEFQSTSLPPDCQAYPLFYDWFLDLGWNGRMCSLGLSI